MAEGAEALARVHDYTPIASPPTSRLVFAVESVRTIPTHRAVFTLAKIVHIMEGDGVFSDESGSVHLGPGATLAFGPGRWCRVVPNTRLRMWTVYFDETFMRTLMGWFLPDRERLLHGVHPHDWTGSPLILTHPLELLEQVEPLWRRLSVIPENTHIPEEASIYAIEILAQWMRIVHPVLLDQDQIHTGRLAEQVAQLGNLSDSSATGVLRRVTRQLQTNMAAPWTVELIAAEAAFSKTHLSRLFSRATGMTPMRYLSELRLTEFTRIIEETEESVADAARFVGWNDPRVASERFVRRFGITPSRYRRTPHPHVTACEHCAGSGS